MKLPLPALFLLLLPVLLSAQNSVKEPGAVKSIRRQGQDIDLRTENAYIRLTVYDPGTIRVRISDRPLETDFSYAVITPPAPTPIKWEEGATTLRLSTDSLELVVDRNPFRLSFRTPGDAGRRGTAWNGRTINEDEKGLGTSWLGSQVTTYKKLQPGERFIGLGEKTGNLDRAGNAYTNWNSDVYGYSISQDPLYSTIPFYIGIHDSLAYGIFLDNSYRTDFNFGASNDRFSSFTAAGGEMNYYLLYQPTVAGIIREYTSLTGRMPLPPLWSLGYQQNRYSYYPDKEVLRIARTLRDLQIPADGITLDIHYMDHYKLFTWDKQRFPNPKAMTAELATLGFKTTVIVDPGVKVEKGYPAYESGKAADLFLKYPDGQYYTGQVWPGWCHLPDFTSEKARSWWRQQVRSFIDSGVAGIWNDMNEWSSWGQKAPDNILFNYDGHPTTHLQGHNVFGLEMARSSYEGARAAMQKRPFILSRSGYAGLQRYAAIWTGDNRAEDDHMLAGVRLLTSLGVSGVAFTGMDIGGFTGNPSPGLYNRWMQLGAFIPYFRNHTALNSKAAEPWVFGEDILDNTRRYISARYTLLPYIYSAFREASLDGLPVARSLAINYTYDPLVYDPRYQNEYLFGDDLLVMPQVSGTTATRIYLPPGEWYDAYTDERHTGGREEFIGLSADHLPVYIKAGSIIPRQSLIQNTTEKPTDTLELHVYESATPNSFTYYEDDGETYAYEKGGYYQRSIHYDPGAHKITLDMPEGQLSSKFHFIRFVLHGSDGSERTSFLPGDNLSSTVKTKTITNDTQAQSLFY